MSNFLLPHPEPTIEQKRLAVAQWRSAAAHERFRVANGLCYGSTTTAEHNARLYDATADQIQAEIDRAMEANNG